MDACSLYRSANTNVSCVAFASHAQKRFVLVLAAMEDAQRPEKVHFAPCKEAQHIGRQLATESALKHAPSQH